MQKIQVLSLLTHLKNIFRWLENISNLSLIFYFICGIEWIVEPNSSHLVSLSRSVKIIKIGSNSSMSTRIVFSSPLNIYESKYAKQNSLCSTLKMNYSIVMKQTELTSDLFSQCTLANYENTVWFDVNGFKLVHYFPHLISESLSNDVLNAFHTLTTL